MRYSENFQGLFSCQTQAIRATAPKIKRMFLHILPRGTLALLPLFFMNELQKDCSKSNKVVELRRNQLPKLRLQIDPLISNYCLIKEESFLAKIS